MAFTSELKQFHSGFLRAGVSLSDNITPRDIEETTNRFYQLIIYDDSTGQKLVYAVGEVKIAGTRLNQARAKLARWARFMGVDELPQAKYIYCGNRG